MAVSPVVSKGASKLNITTPSALPVITPSLQYWITANGSGGQIAGLNLPPISFSSSDIGQTIDFALIDSVVGNVKFSAMNPTLTTVNDGTLYLQGTSAALAQSITVKVELKGRQADRTGYIIVSITNNGGSTLNLKSVVMSMLATHLCASRSYGISTGTGDVYTYDGTNKYLKLTNTGVSNIVTGFATNFAAFSGVSQHYQVADTAIDEVAQITTFGLLTDTISGTATATKAVYLAIGDATNQIAITAGSTATLVFIVAAATSAANVATLMDAAKTNYAADITTFNSMASATKMTLYSPHAVFDMTVDHILGSSTYMAHHQKSLTGSYQFMPAGSYTYYSLFGRDGYYGCKALCQTNDTLIVKDEYLYQIANETGAHAQMHEIIDSFQTTGFRKDASNNGTPGDQEFFTILKFYEYYIATQDSTLLTAQISNLNNIMNYVKNLYDNTPNTYKSTDNLLCGHKDATYLDSGGEQGQSDTYIVDPIMNAVLIHALRALIELNTIVGDTTTATAYTTWRNTLITGMTSLYSSAKSWLVFNKSRDGVTVTTNPHLMKVDALIFDALSDTTAKEAMLTKLAGTSYWNSAGTVAGHTMFPSTDALYSGLGTGWYGSPWNIGDFKALSAMFRYGTNAQAETAWSRLKAICERFIHTNYLRPGEYYSKRGTFAFATGAMVEMIVRGLFGIDAHGSYFTVNPNINKLNGPSYWSMTNLKMGNSLWTVNYSGRGKNISVTIDGGANQTGNINYPNAGSHTLSITASGRQLS